MNIESPEESLYKSIETSNLADCTKELLELGIDEVSNSELIKKLPIVGIVLAGYNTYTSIRDFQFLKKIGIFLFELSKVTQVERTKWLSKLEDPIERKHAGEVIIELLDKVISGKKAEILGIFFRQHIQGKISIQQYITIGEMTAAVYLDNLRYFLKTDEKSLDEIGGNVEILLSTGFLFRGGSGFGGNYFPNKQPNHSEIGKLIYKVLEGENFRL